MELKTVMGKVCAHNNQKNGNIEETGSGGDKKVQSFVEECAALYEHRKKIHPDQYSKSEVYKMQGSSDG